MNRNELIAKLEKHYDSKESIKSILCGRMKPSYEKMCELHNDGVPFTSWKDIKSFINGNTTINKQSTDSTQEKEK